MRTIQRAEKKTVNCANISKKIKSMFSKVRCKWAKNRKETQKIKVCNTENIVHSHIQVFNLRECSRTVFYITEPIFYPRHGR